MNMAAVRARFALKDYNPHATGLERDIAFKKMLAGFRKACNEAQIPQTYKQKAYYESPGEKRRRKKRESELQRLKAKLKENFPEKRKAEKKQYEKKEG